MQSCIAPKLFRHQLEPAKYLYRNRNNPDTASRRIMLYMQMGCGKSATLAECVLTLRCKTVIAVPPPVVTNMQNELHVCGFESTGPERGVKDVLVPIDTKSSDSFEVYLVTHNAIKDLFESNHKMFSGDYMIAYDESQFLRNVSTFHRTNTAIEATNNAKFVVLMTGTPMHTAVKDLYPQLFALDAVEGHLNEADAHQFEVQLRNRDAAVRFFLQLKRRGTRIFFHRNSSRCSHFAKFVHVPDHHVPPTAAMQELVTYMTYKSYGSSKRAVSPFVSKFLEVYTMKKQRKNKRLSDTDIWFMSSNVDFNPSTAGPRACPKTKAMCEYIVTQSQLPAMVLCTRRQAMFGGVDMVAKTIASMGEVSISDQRKKQLAAVRRKALVSAIEKFNTPMMSPIVVIRKDGKNANLALELLRSINDLENTRVDYITVGKSPRADVQKLKVGEVLKNGRQRVTAVDRVPLSDGLDSYWVKLEPVGLVLRSTENAFSTTASVEAIPYKQHASRTTARVSAMKKLQRKLESVQRKLKPEVLPNGVHAVEIVEGSNLQYNGNSYTVSSVNTDENGNVQATLVRNGLITRSTHDGIPDLSNVPVLNQQEYRIYQKHQTLHKKAKARLAEHDRKFSAISLPPRKLKVMTLVGGDDHDHVLQAFADGAVDVIITTLKEGYSLSCKVPGTDDQYLPQCAPLREVHFAGPPTSLGDKLQFEARGNRMMSHSHLPEDEQHIEVHTWVTTAPMSYDSMSARTAQTRASSIKTVENAIESVYGN